MSTLRKQVEKADKAKRKCGDRAEWKALLQEMQVSGHLKYLEATSSIALVPETGAEAEGMEV